ncbi:MAG: hypothetical protein EPN36_14185 [Rhodanobacteraceae bacterium]|nr:MAG: hypothetical protein EPN36_14185 [Rhodanobacteraceae bacterium]
MGKHVTLSLFGMIFLVFAVYILVAGTPLDRINHVCSPIAWSGKAATAVTDLVSDSAAASVWHGTATTFQSCRFVMFRTFYQSEYEREVEQAKRAKSAGHQSGDRAPASDGGDGR